MNYDSAIKLGALMWFNFSWEWLRFFGDSKDSVIRGKPFKIAGNLGP
jgi:hypothetical protein